MNSNEALSIKISKESKALLEELAKSLDGSIIPGFVLEYGECLAVLKILSANM